jgi:predicted DCC family thiol-disulfide oxidoreductase YuxK
MAKPVIFFDGVCNLCNSFVDFTVRNDREGRFLFSSLQGEAAKAMLQLPATGQLSTVVLLDNGRTYIESEAIIKILIGLGGGWRFASLLKLIPGPLRDAAYRFIAAHRYRFFGQKETCRIPSATERARFLL